MEKALATATISIIDQKSTMNAGSEAIIDRKDSMYLGIPEEPKPESAILNNDADDGVRVISIDEYKEAAQCLAEAFKYDHVARYFIDTPDRAHWTEKQKWDLHVSIFEYITYAHCLKGLVTTIGAGYGAVALW